MKFTIYPPLPKPTIPAKPTTLLATALFLRSLNIYPQMPDLMTYHSTPLMTLFTSSLKAYLFEKPLWPTLSAIELEFRIILLRNPHLFVFLGGADPAMSLIYVFAQSL